MILLGGRVAGSIGTNANSTSVEVEGELGKIRIFQMFWKIVWWDKNCENSTIFEDFFPRSLKIDPYNIKRYMMAKKEPD